MFFVSISMKPPIIKSININKILIKHALTIGNDIDFVNLIFTIVPMFMTKLYCS